MGMGETKASQEVEVMKEKLAEYRTKLNLAKEQLTAEKKQLREAKVRVLDVQEAIELVQEVAQQVQHLAHQQIAGVVSRCLESVFGEDAYEFQINFVQKRGKTEAEMVLVRGGMVLDDPVNQAGGGVIEVVGFALRLVALVLGCPGRRRLLVMDEPFVHLSAKYRPAMRDLLEELSGEMGVQMLIVSHSEELICGEVVHLE